MIEQDGIIKEGRLNEVIELITVRPNGTMRIQQDFEFCPSMAEQHTSHLSDINYLMERYKPDELTAYLTARSQYKREIIGHDFSVEPSLQDAKNMIYESKQSFEALPEDVKMNFKNHLEFLKFIDNPANEEKIIKLGLVSKSDLEKIKIQENRTQPSDAKDDVGGQTGAPV